MSSSLIALSNIAWDPLGKTWQPPSCWNCWRPAFPLPPLRLLAPLGGTGTSYPEKPDSPISARDGEYILDHNSKLHKLVSGWNNSLGTGPVLASARTPDALPLVFWRTEQKTQLGAYDRHSQKVGQPAILPMLLTTVPEEFLHLRQGLTLGYIGSKLTCFQDPLRAEKQQWTSTFLNGWLLNRGNWTGFASGTPALRSFIYQDVGVPTCHPCSTTRMYAGLPLLSAMSNLGHLSTCGNRYVVVKRYWVLRGFHLSESVVFHLVYWVSSFLLCLVCVCVSGLFCFGIRKTSGFLHFTCSLTTWE